MLNLQDDSDLRPDPGNRNGILPVRVGGKGRFAVHRQRVGIRVELMLRSQRFVPTDVASHVNSGPAHDRCQVRLGRPLSLIKRSIFANRFGKINPLLLPGGEFFLRCLPGISCRGRRSQTHCNTSVCSARHRMPSRLWEKSTPPNRNRGSARGPYC